MSKVTILHKGERLAFDLRSGLGFQALGARGATPLEFDCRRADCGICVISVLEGSENLSPPTPQEKEFLRAMHADDNERLACQCRILGDVKIEVPDLDP